MKPPRMKLLVLDLDETLLHATVQPLDRAPDFRWEEFQVYLRPGLHAFLREMSRRYDLAIWSSAEDAYVTGITGLMLPPDVEVRFAWGRTQCWLKTVRVPLGNADSGFFQKQHRYIKPLDKLTRLGYKRGDLLIVDDTAAKVEDNDGRHLIVKPFEGDAADTELPALSAYLQAEGARPSHDAWRWRELR